MYSSLEYSIECVEGTRPSVNYAKDWLGQLFLIRGLVSSEKGNHSWMRSLWGILRGVRVLLTQCNRIEHKI